MKILKRDIGTLEWTPLDHEPTGTVYRIKLSDDQTWEISEEQDREGLSYLAVRTPEGILAIYPENANKVSFRIVGR